MSNPAWSAWSPPTAGSSIASMQPARRSNPQTPSGSSLRPIDGTSRLELVGLMAPVTQYAQSAGASIAYQVIGEGPLDMLFLPGWISQVEQLWEAPANRRFMER